MLNGASAAGVQWGTLGEWFSGIGGFFAVGVAVYYARREHGLRVQAEFDRDRDLASQLSVRRLQGAKRQPELTTYVIEIRNHARNPFRVERLVALHSEAPGNDKQEFYVGQLVGGELSITREAASTLKSTDDDYPEPHDRFVVYYLDTGGRQWRTDNDGNVEHLPVARAAVPKWWQVWKRSTRKKPADAA